MTPETEEILDLVNENDEIIGNMPRSEVYAQDLHNFRVINCFIKNSEGKLWIPRREAHKKLFPNALGISCGGHVSSGETYDIAFAKEVIEELNIDISKIDYEVLGTMTPKDGVNAFMTVYEIKSDIVPTYNEDDFSGYEWLLPAEILERLASGDTSQDDLPVLIKKFYM